MSWGPIIGFVLQIAAVFLKKYVNNSQDREKAIKEFLLQIEKFDKNAVDNVTNKKEYDDLKKKADDWLNGQDL